MLFLEMDGYGNVLLTKSEFHTAVKDHRPEGWTKHSLSLGRDENEAFDLVERAVRLLRFSEDAHRLLK